MTMVLRMEKTTTQKRLCQKKDSKLEPGNRDKHIFHQHCRRDNNHLCMFAVYLLFDPNGPPTAFLLFRPHCTVGILAGTRAPSDAQAGWHREQSANPYVLHCCCTAEPVMTRASKHTPSVKHTRRGFWPTRIAPTTVFVTFTPFITS